MTPDVLETVLHLVVTHSLRHDSDPIELAVAIEFLKAVRDEPEHVAFLYEQWADVIQDAQP